MTDIFTPTQEIETARTRWKRNREILEGEDAVKAACKATQSYLPLPGKGTKFAMSETAYCGYVDRTPFFPGAARTLDGLKGLIFRKAPMLELPRTDLAPIFDTITTDGLSYEDLAEEAVNEMLSVGFGGLLVDYPEGAKGAELTAADFAKKGFRPFIGFYPAENILEVTTGVINNQQKIVRVRVTEGDWQAPASCRELFLDMSSGNPVYTVIVHTIAADGSIVSSGPIVPRKKSAPLDTIPFYLLTTKPRVTKPHKGPLDDVVRLNAQLFKEQADAKNSRYYSSAPILVIKGAEEQKEIAILPGVALQYPNSTPEKPVDVKFSEFSGAGQETLERAVTEVKNEMASVGSRILANEKVAAEAAETLAIRKASENATLAAFTRLTSRTLKEAMDRVAWWLDAGEVKFELSTDFLPMPMNSEELKAVVATWQAGAISRETLWDMMDEGEMLPRNFDREIERQRLDSEALNADRPSTQTAASALQVAPSPAKPTPDA